MIQSRSIRSREFGKSRAEHLNKSQHIAPSAFRKQVHLEKSIYREDRQSKTPTRHREYKIQRSRSRLHNRSQIDVSSHTSHSRSQISHKHQQYQPKKGQKQVILRQSNHKVKEVCVNCVNKIIMDKKAEEKRKQKIRDQEIEQELFRRQKEEERLSYLREEARAKQEKDLNKEIVEKHEAQKAKKRKQRQQDASRIRQAAAYAQKQEILQNKIDKEVRQKFSKELKEQVDAQIRRRKEQAEQRRKGASEPMFNEYREEAQAKIRNDEYREDLIKQINDNQRRRLQQITNQKKLEKQALATVSNIFYQPNIDIHEQHTYAKDLQQQILDKKEHKAQQHRKELQLDQTIIDLKQKQNEDAIKKEREIRSRQMESYLSDLSRQIQNNRNRRIKQLEFDKLAGFSQEQPRQVEPMQNCDNCHILYPRKFLSIVDVD